MKAAGNHRAKGRLSLFAFFAAVLTAGWLLVMALAYLGLRDEMESRLMVDLDRKAALALESLRGSASLLIAAGRADDLQALVENAAANRLIKRIRVIGLDGSVIASSDPLERGGPARDDLAAALISGGALRLESREGGGFEAAMPVKGEAFSPERGTDAVAVVQYEADMAAERASLDQAVLSLIALAGLSYAAVLALCLFLVGAFVSRPLKAFGRAAQGITAGDYSVRMRWRRNDELRDFAELFNRMIEEIERKNEELTGHSRSLEKTVEERTESLKRANARLLEERDRAAEAERLSAVARVVGGIAHEVNNPASFVSSNLRTLARYAREARAIQSRRGEAGPLAEMLEDAVNMIAESSQGMERIARIVEALQVIVATGGGAGSACAVDDILSESVSDRARQLPPGIELSLSLGSGALVRARESDLRRVFAAILENAAEAVGGAGRVVASSSREGSMAVVAVSDDGKGLDEEAARRVFDPFFTTKAAGAGKGLSLAVAKAVVERSGGTIEAKRGPERGATFVVRLPAIEAGEDGKDVSGR